MQIIRQIFLLLAFVGAMGGSYLYFHKVPCAQPITYRIGTVDPRFGVSEAQFKADLERAGGVWDAAIGKPLFAYAEKGEVIVNLVYDTRQQITQKEQVLSATIDETKQTAASVKAEFEALKAQYAAAEQSYSSALTSFNQAQDTYSAQVSYWNSKGGAPQKEYAALVRQKNDLTAQHDTLEQKRVELNALASKVSTYVAKYNSLVRDINTNINTINNDGLTGTQFEEGVYISDEKGKRINIYQFENKTDLLRVLAHELGHSLGLSHNENPESIMNPINRGDSLTLSEDDLLALKAQCNSK